MTTSVQETATEIAVVMAAYAQSHDPETRKHLLLLAAQLQERLTQEILALAREHSKP